MLKWQKDGHLELMREAAFSTTVEEEEKSLQIIQGGHYFIKWDGIKPREITARHSQGWEWSGCGQCAWKRVGNGFRGKEGLELSGKMLSHVAEPGKALQCSSAEPGVGLMEGVCAWPGCTDPVHLLPHTLPSLPSAGLGIWPGEPWPAANLLETMGSVFLGF